MLSNPNNEKKTPTEYKLRHLRFRRKAGGIFGRNYFCRIANFDEDILNHAELLQVQDFYYGGFDLELWRWRLKT